MLDRDVLSPYIRRAMRSTLTAPFVIYPRELYDYELIYIKEGCCRFQIEGRDHIGKKNNVVFLPPGTVHSFHCVQNTDLVQPHIHFDAVYSDKSRITPISFTTRECMLPSEIELIQKNMFAEIGIPYVFVPEDPDTFRKLFFRIVDSYDENVGMTLSEKADMLKLLELILNQFAKTPAPKAPPSHTVLHTLKNYIDGNYYNALSLDFLAKSFYLNKFTMMRRFKAAYGISIIRYYNNKRADAAKELLRSTNMTVKAIGETLHFTDAYSFSRFFKDNTGIAPLPYRKRYRTGEAPERERK